MPSFNYNPLNASIQQSTLLMDVTTTNDGDFSSENYITGGKFSSSEHLREQYYKLPIGAESLITLTNTETTEQILTILFIWYELDYQTGSYK